MDLGVRRDRDFGLDKRKRVGIVGGYFEYKGKKLGIDMGGGLFNLVLK